MVKAMNEMRNRKGTEGVLRGQSGMVLVTAMWLLVVLSVIGAAANVASRTDIGVAGNFKTETEAVYLAEAGMQRALGRINEDVFWTDNLVAAGTTTDVFAADTPDNTLGNGHYEVDIYPNEPVDEWYRIVSTGVLDNGGSASIEAILRTTIPESMTYAAFGCTNFTLNTINGTYITGPIYSQGQLDLGGAGTADASVNGTALAYGGNLTISGASWVAPDAAGEWTGDALGNKHITVSSTASPAIDGDVWAGLNFFGAGIVSGTVHTGVSPVPVENQCTAEKLTENTITYEEIQDYIANATAHPANVAAGATFPPADGVYYVGSNMSIGQNGAGPPPPAVYQGSSVFIVQGSVVIYASGLQPANANSVISFLLPGNANFSVGGDTTLRSNIQVGSILRDGSASYGGKFFIGNGIDVTVLGSVVTVKNVFLSNNGGKLTLTLTELNQKEFKKKYTLGGWRRI